MLIIQRPNGLCWTRMLLLYTSLGHWCIIFKTYHWSLSKRLESASKPIERPLQSCHVQLLLSLDYVSSHYLLSSRPQRSHHPLRHFSGQHRKPSSFHSELGHCNEDSKLLVFQHVKLMILHSECRVLEREEAWYCWDSSKLSLHSTTYCPTTPSSASQAKQHHNKIVYRTTRLQHIQSVLLLKVTHYTKHHSLCICRADTLAADCGVFQPRGPSECIPRHHHELKGLHHTHIPN